MKEPSYNKVLKLKRQEITYENKTRKLICQTKIAALMVGILTVKENSNLDFKIQKENNQ